MLATFELKMSSLSADKGHSPFPSSERAVYGFALWLSSFLLVGTYLVWAVLPDSWLTAIGLSYFPQKYWAVAILSYLTVCLVIAVVLYIAVNLTMVTTFSDPRTVEDPHPQFYNSPSSPPVHSIPPLYDITITQVNKVLYHQSNK